MPIEDTMEMFDEIAIAVQEAESGIREISDATDDQAASSEEVVSMVDEVSGVNQQTAAEASNVSENVQGLSRLSETLHDQVSTFTIRIDRAVEAGSAVDTTHQSAVQADGGESSTPKGDLDSSLGGK